MGWMDKNITNGTGYTGEKHVTSKARSRANNQQWAIFFSFFYKVQRL